MARWYVHAMTETNGADRDPVTSQDVHQAVQLAVAALSEATEADWSAAAGSLEWDCWETVEHLSDDLFAYAVQLGPGKPPLTGEVPFLFTRQRPGGPRSVIFADREAGTAGLLQVLEASGALLVALVRTTPPETRSYHGYGVSDPEGFAAMGVVETLVHAHDVAEGLGIPWTPPDDLCRRALARLFPDTEVDAGPWLSLLWATGRAELPGHPRRTTWRWDGTPLDDDAPPPSGPHIRTRAA
jgi:hypothetical protein